MDAVLMLEKAKEALKQHEPKQDTDSCGGEKVVLIQSQQMHFKVKQNSLTKTPENQQLYPNYVFDVEEKLIEEINI